MTDTTPFAFLVHPRRQIGQDLARVWGPLARVPERCYDTALKRLPLPATTIARVTVDGHDGPLGEIVLVPYAAGHLLADPARGAVGVARAVDHAVHRGARLVGLGALTAPVTAGGLALRHRTDVGVTNGNAFTAAVVDRQVRDVLDGLVGPVGGRVAVVGATGSVGSAVVRSLARDRAAEQLLLVARGAGRRHRRGALAPAQLSGAGPAARPLVRLPRRDRPARTVRAPGALQSRQPRARGPGPVPRAGRRDAPPGLHPGAADQLRPARTGRAPRAGAGMTRPLRVVLLGGGYVTLHAYRALARRLRPELRRGRVEVVVVSADDAHSFHGFTPEVVAGHLPFAATRTPLRSVLPLARVLHARVVLVQGGERLVPQLADGFPSLARRVGEGLRGAGVELVLGDRVVSCGPDGVALASGRWIPSRTVLATVGAAPVRLPGLEGLPVDTAGRLVTRSDLSVTDRIWAAGDVARVLHPVTGEPVPATALWAIKGGALVGANLARALRGRTTRHLRYRGLGQAAVLGRGSAVAELYGIPLGGRLAWCLRLAFFLRFVPSAANARLVLRHTVHASRTPVQLDPRHTDLSAAA